MSNYHSGASLLHLRFGSLIRRWFLAYPSRTRAEYVSFGKHITRFEQLNFKTLFNLIFRRRLN